jgi:RimJ/RimL family protein N-acetyltransferase
MCACVVTEIRCPEPEDAPAIKGLADEAMAEGVGWSAMSIADIKTSIWAASNLPDYAAWIATRCGRVCAFLTCAPLEELQYPEIIVFVTQNARRGGVGKRLVQEAIAWARATPDVSLLEAWIVENNVAAINLVEQLGFWFAAHTRRKQEVQTGDEKLEKRLYCLETYE